MKSNLEKISFRKAVRSDLPLLKSWFDKPHVKEFWDISPEMWENVDSYLNEHKVLYDYWIGSLGGIPYCLIITSDAKEMEPSAPGSDNRFLPWLEADGLNWTIDFMIGEEVYLGKGLSFLSLEAFTQSQKNISAFFIDPEVNNAKARHVYAKAGFLKVANFTPQIGSFSGLEHVLMKKKTI